MQGPCLSEDPKDKDNPANLSRWQKTNLALYCHHVVSMYITLPLYRCPAGWSPPRILHRAETGLSGSNPRASFFFSSSLPSFLFFLCLFLPFFFFLRYIYLIYFREERQLKQIRQWAWNPTWAPSHDPEVRTWAATKNQRLNPRATQGPQASFFI